MQNKIREFRKMGIEAKLTTLYKEIIELKEAKQELPPEITNRLYTLREASELIKMSREWLSKEIRAGRIQAQFEKGKYYMSWQEIENVKEIRNERY